MLSDSCPRNGRGMPKNAEECSIEEWPRNAEQCKCDARWVIRTSEMVSKQVAALALHVAVL
eukprot:15484091-Alexandrium_andersonii.AAC.1